MQKTILLTGSTDGIGLATAEKLVSLGHHVILHGRNASKLAKAEAKLAELGSVESIQADLSSLKATLTLVEEIKTKHDTLDIIINNAGVFKLANAGTVDNLDARFAVNTLAPYLLTEQLLPLLPASGRVINLSSAAQAPVNLDALIGRIELENDFDAYAQSKLALTIWSQQIAQSLPKDSPAIIALNPG